MGSGVMEWKPTLQRTYGPNMNAFWWVVHEIYPTWETCLQLCEKLCRKFHEHDGCTNERTERRKLYTPRHKCRGGGGGGVIIPLFKLRHLTHRGPCEQNIWRTAWASHDICHTDCVQGVDDLINFWQNSVNIWMSGLSPFSDMEIS